MIDDDTREKPEVAIMAEFLRIDPDAVLGKLVGIWHWADKNSVDGNDVRVTDAFIDRLAHCRNFASAMREAKWLFGNSGHLVFPNFDRHNGKSAKNRAQTARRVADHRKRNVENVTSVTQEPLLKPLPDKSNIRETSSLSPLPPDGGDAIESGFDSVSNKIRGLRREWGRAGLNAGEARALRKNLSVLAEFGDSEWEIVREYLGARLPEGKPGWQPRIRIEFIRTATDVFGYALERDQMKKQAVAGRVAEPVKTLEREKIPRSELAQYFGKKTA